MAKFVAHQAVALNHFAELGHIADTGPSDIHNETPSGFIVTQGNIDFVFKGSGITYQVIPQTGTLTSLDIVIDDVSTYKFTGFHISVQQASNFFFQGNPQQFVSTFLGGNTTIIGSDFDDVLPGGTGNDSIKGKDGNDKLIGGAGNDKLDGGFGTDKLSGGAGNDQLYFTTALDGLVNIDTVSGFNSTFDDLYLDDGVFGALGADVTPDEFRKGAGVAPADSTFFIFYDGTTGALSFNADAAGPNPFVQFATLTGAPNITREDFVIG